MSKVSYYIAKQLEMSFEEAVAAVTETLKTEGFGVLTEIDVQATLKEKLDVEFRKYLILGACNPSFAHQALECEARIGLMLPCNVIVHESPGGGVEIAAIDPVASMLAVENPSLGELGLELRQKLTRAVERVGAA